MPCDALPTPQEVCRAPAKDELMLALISTW